MEPARKDDEAAQLTMGQRDIMDDSAGKCPVCSVPYEDTSRRPCSLPCGHSFCNLCINRVETQGQVRCPTCRLEHALPESGQFPINYALEDFMRSVRESSQNEATGLNRPMCSMLQKQETNVLAAIGTCQEVQVQLDQYQTTLVNWGEQQQNVEDELQGLVDGLQALLDQSRDARVIVRQEESLVAAKKQQVQQGEQQLHALLQNLCTVTTEQKVGVASVDVAHCINEEKHRAEECREMFPGVHTVTTISKVNVASKAALKAVQTVEGTSAGIARDTNIPADQASTITEKLQVLLATTMENCSSFHLEPHSLQAEDLRTLTQPARSLLQAGLVFGVHQEEGRIRHARITLEDGRLYLHSLQDKSPPPGAVTMQMDELVPTVLPCLVFLDLAWPRNAPRRVLIRLSLNTPRGRQFLLLCTGQRGPCYANTRLWKVRDKGRPGECVFGGDYWNNDGTGGAALLPDLEKGIYWESGQAGAVWWWRNDPARGTLFCITTKDWPDGSMPGVFGKVVGGLDGVVAAAQHSPITEVTVVDCGVVLWAQCPTTTITSTTKSEECFV